MLDPLTQVHSRYAYDHRVDEEFGRWLRYGQPLSFAIWDVDHFKSINDTFGHKAGDRALTKLAQLVPSNLRDSDFLARVGGEEFVVLMPGLEAEQSSQAIEKLIATIETAGSTIRENGSQSLSPPGLPNSVRVTSPTSSTVAPTARSTMPSRGAAIVWCKPRCSFDLPRAALKLCYNPFGRRVSHAPQRRRS